MQTETKPYRRDHFSRRDMIRDMSFPGGPRPGDPFPDFSLVSAEGKRVAKQDLEGRPALITFGSRTCPMTAAANTILGRLQCEFGEEARFVTVYVREAHPGDRVEQPRTFERKVENARRMVRRDGVTWDVLVDGVDGGFHRRFGGHPSSAYVLDSRGDVVYRVLWANDEAGLRRGLRAALRGLGEVGESKARMIPLLSGVGAMSELLDEAGPQAKRDVLRQAPPMYAMARLASLFRPLPPAARGALAAGIAVLGVYAASRAAAAACRRDSR